MEEIKLGKIISARLGNGGYQDAQFGIWFHLGGDGWGVSDGRGVWFGEPSKYAKWTIEDKKKTIGEIMFWLEDIMTKAKVSNLEKLKGVPVECTFERGGLLKSWRILTEVL